MCIGWCNCVTERVLLYVSLAQRCTVAMINVNWHHFSFYFYFLPYGDTKCIFIGRMYELNRDHSQEFSCSVKIGAKLSTIAKTKHKEKKKKSFLGFRGVQVVGSDISKSQIRIFGSGILHIDLVNFQIFSSADSQLFSFFLKIIVWLQLT